jgi:hypothetical protein
MRRHHAPDTALRRLRAAAPLAALPVAVLRRADRLGTVLTLRARSTGLRGVASSGQLVVLLDGRVLAAAPGVVTVVGAGSWFGVVASADLPPGLDDLRPVTDGALFVVGGRQLDAFFALAGGRTRWDESPEGFEPHDLRVPLAPLEQPARSLAHPHPVLAAPTSQAAG